MQEAPTYTAVFGNTWGGRLIEVHVKELALYKSLADLCFLSEVHHYESGGAVPAFAHTENQAQPEPPVTVNQYNIITDILSEHEYYFSVARQHVITCTQSRVTYPEVGFGNVRAFKSSVSILDHGSPAVYGKMGERSHSGVNPRSLDYVVVGGNEPTIVAHLHGVWIAGNTKGDAPEREEQSEGVRRVLRILSQQYSTNRIILGGDFNLDLDTEALRYLEEGDGAEDVPLQNLIRSYGIDSTRTPHYRHYNMPGYSLFADYVLVSDDIAIHDFTVRENSASDHMHLQLTWS